VTAIDGVESGNLKVKVLEGRVGNITITPVDKDGNKTKKPGIVPPHVIMREIPVQVTSPSSVPGLLSVSRVKCLAPNSCQGCRKILGLGRGICAAKWHADLGWEKGLEAKVCV
jgi:hypothetical protein